MNCIHAKVLGLLTCLFLNTAVFSQANFSIGDTIVYLNKDVSFGTLHEYTTISSSDTLQMRWIKRPSSRYPSAWNTYWTAADTVYGLIDNLDSADFVLIPPLDTTLVNRLIIGVEHNGVAANSNIDFTLFEVGNRQDSLKVRFQVSVASLSTTELNTPKLEVFPTVSQDGLFRIQSPSLPLHQDEFILFDAAGNTIPFDYSALGDEGLLKLKTNQSGTYYLHLKNNKHIIKLVLSL